MPGVGIIYEEDGCTLRSVMGWQRAHGVLSNFAGNEIILHNIKSILGAKVEFHQTKYNPKAPDESGRPWEPHRGDTYWHYKDGIVDTHRMCSVFIAMTDQTENNGAVSVWKGSHVVTLEDIKSDMTGIETQDASSDDTGEKLSQTVVSGRLQEFNDLYPRVLLTGRAGTVWFLDPALLHESAANLSGQVRELVANVFRSTDNRPQHPREHAYLSEPANGPL